MHVVFNKMVEKFTDDSWREIYIHLMIIVSVHREKNSVNASLKRNHHELCISDKVIKCAIWEQIYLELDLIVNRLKCKNSCRMMFL